MTVFSNFGKYGIVAAGGGGGPTLGTGGSIVALNGYNYHVFTSSGTFQVTQGGTNEAGALVIAGGGAGGGSIGGGGGAGGVLYSSASFPLSTGSYTVTVGAGGVRSPAYAGLPSAPGRSQSGSNSSLGPHVALGGGGGGSYSYQFAAPGNHGGSGGSGGGGGGQYPGGGPPPNTVIPSGTQPANNPSPSVWTTYGNPGGKGSDGPYQGSGGGGSGGVGNTAFGQSTPSNDASYNYGHGGVAQPFAGWPGPGLGLPAIPSNFWAAGGEGNGYPGNSGSGTARNGIGGGAGTNMADGTKADGVTNSGSGGGGSTYNGNPLFGLGGSGIVIIRYLLE